MRKSKKGQVTLFVVIAIMLIAAVATVLSMRVKMPEKAAPTQIRPIQTYVKNCIESVGLNALYLIGQQGGYFESPKPPFEHLDVHTAYFFTKSKNTMPPRRKVEKEISEYINLNLPFCTADFVNFPDFDVEESKVSTETLIKEKDVLLKVRYLLTIKKADTTYRLSQFEVRLSIRLGEVYELCNDIINEQVSDPSTICLTCIVDNAAEKNIYVNLDLYSEDDIVFTLTDMESTLNETEYEFIFATEQRLKI